MKCFFHSVFSFIFLTRGSLKLSSYHKLVECIKSACFLLEREIFQCIRDIKYKLYWCMREWRLSGFFYCILIMFYLFSFKIYFEFTIRTWMTYDLHRYNCKVAISRTVWFFECFCIFAEQQLNYDKYNV